VSVVASRIFYNADLFIRPANILLSDEDVPVLVDFGFAEKYDLGSSKAFRSNLAYGTPEVNCDTFAHVVHNSPHRPQYLSPERARGHHHDTRKSDVWSLGITFFEILIGRTPFEYVEGEQFSTKEDLEKYWTRTVSPNPLVLIVGELSSVRFVVNGSAVTRCLVASRS